MCRTESPHRPGGVVALSGWAPGHGSDRLARARQTAWGGARLVRLRDRLVRWMLVASKRGVRCVWAVAYGGARRRPDDTTSKALRGSRKHAQAPTRSEQ
ncbi:hypothetical protein SCNRRL3882_6700 [Streptomyces chartreusis NRRL 3882]|uniref:Uncharacterized protein n=1 Tax=Streptomyces chartreusis NRRL 3882 TaxID=1079985 RepID=A0A2N9BIS3_STRCX|nr:hypothetical protein SCNRRL3882_6700 [Streptomyces chartreusis NRRL 3882]